MGVKWKNGKGIQALQVKIKERGEDLKEDAESALVESLADGATLTEQYLEEAVTRTGKFRAEHFGGYPGRHRSGTMISRISHDTAETIIHGGEIIVGSFGWFSGDFEQYFQDQDLGEGNIPAARALPNAFAQAKELFAARMRLVARNKPAD